MSDADPNPDGPPWDDDAPEADVVERDPDTDDMFGSPEPAGMREAEDLGYEIVLSVHDELITETPDDEGWTHEDLAEIMSDGPAWAEGLPLAAAGFETHRYRKDD